MIANVILLFFMCKIIASSPNKLPVKIPSENAEMVKKLHDSCIQKLKLSESDFAKFDVSKKSPQLMCYLQCIFVSSKWMDENQIIDVEFIKKKVPPFVKDIVIPNLDKCCKAAVGEGCEKSYNFFKCFNNINPEVFVLI